MSLNADLDKIAGFEIEEILKMIEEIDKSFNLLPHNEDLMRGVQKTIRSNEIFLKEIEN